MNQSFHANALAGIEQPVHEPEPQAGWYRRKRQDGSWEPVYIEADTGEAFVGTTDDGGWTDAAEVWTWCCRNPVTQEAYEAVVYDGKAWPDDTGLGHNAPPEGASAFLQEIENAAEALATFLKEAGDPKGWTQAQRDKAQNFRDRLSKLAGDADKSRAAEKEPHFRAGQAVDKAWKPVITRATEEKDRAAKALLVALKAEDDRQAAIRRAEEKRLREEAEAAARAAAEAAKAGQEDALADLLDRAGEAKAQAAQAAQPAPPVRSGTMGRSTSLKTKTVYEIRDLGLVLEWMQKTGAGLQEVEQLAQKTVDKVMKLGDVPVPPGVVAREERMLT